MLKKLCLETVKKLYKLTGAEIDLFLHLAYNADEKGVVKGVYYKEAIESTDLSITHFYHSMDALQDKGFIKHTKEKDERWVGEERARFTVLILNNDYSEIMAMGADKRKGLALKPYVSLNPEILHTREFREATKNVKILILKFLELLNTKPYKGKEKFSFNYKDLLAWTMIYCKDSKSRKEVSLRALKRYIRDLKVFFTIEDDPTNQVVHIHQETDEGDEIFDDLKLPFPQYHKGPVGRLFKYILRSFKRLFSHEDELNECIKTLYKASENNGNIFDVYRIKDLVTATLDTAGAFASTAFISILNKTLQVKLF